MITPLTDLLEMAEKTNWGLANREKIIKLRNREKSIKNNDYYRCLLYNVIFIIEIHLK
jgi:hypothetical protein